MILTIDNPRFLNLFYCEQCLRGALAFSLFFPGIPILYYGDEQYFQGGADPYRREALWPRLGNRYWGNYPYVKALVAARRRNEVWNYPYHELYYSKDILIFSRGNVIVAFNINRTYYEVIKLKVSYADGSVLREIYSRLDITVTDGIATIVIGPRETLIYEKVRDAED